MHQTGIQASFRFEALRSVMQILFNGVCVSASGFLPWTRRDHPEDRGLAHWQM